MNQMYSHKSFVGRVTRAVEDGTLVMFQAEIPYKSGELIFEDLDGNKQIITESRFEEYYVPVTIKKRKKKVKLSPFEEQYAKQILEFGQMEMNCVEDQDYIDGTKNRIID